MITGVDELARFDLDQIDEKTIQIVPGRDIEIQVSEMGSTGYVWKATVGSEARIMEHRITPNLQTLGGSGKEVFVLRTDRPGIHLVEFTLARPWNRQVARRVKFQLDSRALEASKSVK